MFCATTVWQVLVQAVIPSVIVTLYVPTVVTLVVAVVAPLLHTYMGLVASVATLTATVVLVQVSGPLFDAVHVGLGLTVINTVHDVRIGHPFSSMPRTLYCPVFDTEALAIVGFCSVLV